MKLALSAAFFLPAAAAFAAEALDFGKDIRPVLQEYCVSCHSAEKKKGDLDMEPMLAKLDLATHHDEWEKVMELMESREMPPEKKPQPSEHQRGAVTAWVEHQLHSLAQSEPSNPGRVTLRRLNKDEYRRTIHSLLNVDFRPDDFPDDDMGYGFNNIGDVLSLSPMLMEKYMAAAETIARKAIVAEPVKVPKTRLRGDRFSTPTEWIQLMEGGVMGFHREGESTAGADFLRTGEYVIRLRAYAELAGPEAPKLALKVGGKETAVFKIDSAKSKTYEARVTAQAGRQQIGVAYLNNYNDTTNANVKLRGDRNVFLESVEIEGPFDGKPEPQVRVAEARRWQLAEGVGRVDEKALGFSSSSEARIDWQFPAKDEYIVRVRATGDRGGDELPKMRLSLGGRELAVFEVTGTDKKESVHDTRVSVGAGKQQLALAFLNDHYDAAKGQDRNALVRSVEIVGPINAAAPELPESHRRLVGPMPEPGKEREAARAIVAKFATRAYRRPVADAEIDRLVKFVDISTENGGSFLEGIQAAVQAALCSPQFLYRWELDGSAVKPGDIRNLGDYEIASRLSYFLWSTMPDEELFALAERGELTKDGNIEKQIERMLKDWKARALVENFGGQWLQLHNINDVDPDPKRFPKFSYELREDMKREVIAFMEAIVKEDRSVLDIVDAKFTFLNERLARLYDIEGIKGNEFRRVELPQDSVRGGVLTMGGILLATSMPTRTSPVIRGKWILEQLLGSPPPPPPPNVSNLDERKIDQSLSFKKRLEIHRDNPDCAGCHAKIDPLGFALEQFDAIGAFRTMDGNTPVDATGMLPNGTPLNGAGDLKRVIKGEKFARTLAENLMIYALGRGLERYDRNAVDAVLSKTKDSGYKFSALAKAVVTSEPFLKRKTAEKRVAAQ